MESYGIKDKWIKQGMYAFVCWDWVNPFVEWIGTRKCLEIMSGAGWLAKALREKNVDIIATDDYSWVRPREWKIVSEVIEMNATSAIHTYGSQVDILIVSWPYMDDDAYNAIKTLHQVNPNALIVYIGEWESGCTASDKFFLHFEELNDENFQKVQDAYKTWWALHDTIYLGRYYNEQK